jgi:hypothetical protein
MAPKTAVGFEVDAPTTTKIRRIHAVSDRKGVLVLGICLFGLPPQQAFAPGSPASSFRTPITLPTPGCRNCAEVCRSRRNITFGGGFDLKILDTGKIEARVAWRNPPVRILVAATNTT